MPVVAQVGKKYALDSSGIGCRVEGFFDDQKGNQGSQTIAHRKGTPNPIESEHGVESIGDGNIE